MLSFPAYGRELLCEASEAETSGEYAFLLSLPSCFCVTFLNLSKTKIRQRFISDPSPMGPAAFILHCVPFLQVDGVSYLLQEIYGIENKYNSQESKVTPRERFVSVSLRNCLPP